MKKFSTKSTNKLLISFILKSVISTIISILLFTFLSSEIMYKLDIDLNKISYISLIIVGLSSFFISIISVSKIKNSGIIFGIFSQLPLVFYMFINAVFYNNNWLYFVIKLLIVLLIGALTGLITSERNKKFKVK